MTTNRERLEEWYKENTGLTNPHMDEILENTSALLVELANRLEKEAPYAKNEISALRESGDYIDGLSMVLDEEASP